MILNEQLNRTEILDTNKLSATKIHTEDMSKRMILEAVKRQFTEDELRKHQVELETIIAKQTEDLRKKNEELQLYKHRYRFLADNVRTVIWSTDMKMNYTYINPSVYQMYGYTVEEAIRLKPDKWYPPQALERIKEVYRDWNNRKKQGNLDASTSIILEVEHFRKDKSLFPVEIKFTLIRDSRGRATGVLGITRDLSEREISRELQVQIEQMMHISGMSAGIAHEINNPLTTILQSARIIQNRITGKLEKNRRLADESGTTIEKVENYLNRRGISPMLNAISDSCRRMTNIVRDMLCLAHKGNSKHVHEDINKLLDRAVDIASLDYTMNRKTNFHNIKINRKYDQALPLVLCKPGRLLQVFLNILSNGSFAMSKYTVEGMNPCFTLRTGIENNSVRIDIEDNGCGMDEQTQKKIFEPFFSTKEIGTGTGLGMSVSHFIVTDNHNGQIKVESAPKAGARFTINLPLK